MIQSHLTDPPNQTSPHLLPMLCFYCIILPTNSSTLYCEIVADLEIIEIIGDLHVQVQDQGDLEHVK